MENGIISRNNHSVDGIPTSSHTLAWTVTSFIQLVKYAHFGLRNRIAKLHLKCKQMWSE